MSPAPNPSHPKPDPSEVFLDGDEELLREVPLEVVQRLGGALSPAEVVEATRAKGETVPRVLLRAYLESARIQLNSGDTEQALEELELVHRLLRRAGGAGEALEASELKKDVERSLVARSVSPENTFRVFAEVNEIIHSGDSLGEKISQVLVRVADAVGADRGFWATYEPGRSDLAVSATTELDRETATGLLAAILGGGRDILARGRPVISVGVGSDERFRFRPELGEINSLLFVPCGTGRESSGLVYFDRLAAPDRRSFTQTDLDLVTALATPLAVIAVEAHLGLEVRANVDLRRRLTEKYSWHNVVTRNKEMQEVLRVLERISPSNMTVLLQGETGTGKLLLAQAIHQASPRREKPFVTIDCAALSAQLLESELFGHLRGAFTGATTDRKGLFEEARGGTVFLDEIDKTNHELQRRLLHVVDQGEVRPLGAPEYRHVDVRIVCATSNPDLRQAVEDGRFIKDLFYRLNDISITLPPLRERKEDLEMLVQHFGQRHCRELGRKEPARISRAVMELFMDYDWPGNVRELEKMMRRAVVLAEEGEEIQPRLLPPEIRGERPAGRSEGPAAPEERAAPSSLAAQVEQVERRELLAALNRAGWNKSQAARELGLTRKGLRMKIERYGLEPG